VTDEVGCPFRRSVAAILRHGALLRSRRRAPRSAPAPASWEACCGATRCSRAADAVLRCEQICSRSWT
jgi:hypothetical protein